MKPKRANNDAAKAQREQDILLAALELFAKQGFHATKMTDIADKIGLSKGTLYLYFANKDDLFRTLITRLAGNKITHITTLLNEYDDLEKTLDLLTTEMLSVLCYSPLPKLIRVLISEAALFPEMVMFYRKHVIERGIAALITRFGGNEQAHILAQLFMAPFILSILRQEILFTDQPDDEVTLRHLLQTQQAMIIDYLKRQS